MDRWREREGEGRRKKGKGEGGRESFSPLREINFSLEPPISSKNLQTLEVGESIIKIEAHEGIE